MIAASVDTVRETGRASVLLHPLRLEIVRELRQPDSASGLARKLSLPRQKLNYHLRELEKAGFVKLVEERRKGNCTERILQATATSYVVHPAALGDIAADPDHVEDRFSSSYLIALAARMIRDLASLRERAARAQKKLPTLSLSTDVRFGSQEAQAGFAKELTRELSRLIAKYHDAETPGGRKFRLVLASYPATKEKSS